MSTDRPSGTSASVTGSGATASPLPWWRRLRAGYVKSTSFLPGDRIFGDRLEVVDDRLTLSRWGLWVRPRLIVDPEGLILPVHTWSISGGRRELRRWDREWTIEVRPRWNGRARLVITAPDTGYSGRLAGEWSLDYADMLVALIDLIRTDHRAQAGLGDLERIDAVVAVFNGHAITWPVRGATRAEYVLRARSILRGTADLT